MSALNVHASVDRFNRLPTPVVEPALRRCLAVARWSRELAAGRPYPDVDHLFAAGERLTEELSDDEVRRALADHPKIGETPIGAAAWSAAEQSGVDRQDSELAAALRAVNTAYEERFGYLYLVCASGRDGRALLADAERRLRNDPATELAVVRTELGKIARRRLATVLAELAAA